MGEFREKEIVFPQDLRNVTILTVRYDSEGKVVFDYAELPRVAHAVSLAILRSVFSGEPKFFEALINIVANILAHDPSGNLEKLFYGMLGDMLPDVRHNLEMIKPIMQAGIEATKDKEQ